MEIKNKTFAAVYEKLLYQLMNNADYESCPRGQKTKEIMDITLEIEDPTQCLYHNNKRSSQFKYIAAEFVWYFYGDRSIKYIDRYAKFWKNIAHSEIPFKTPSKKEYFSEEDIKLLNGTDSERKLILDKQLKYMHDCFDKHILENGVVNSAYGDLIFRKKNKYDYSQYHWAFESLVKDKDSRQAIIHFNLPEHQYEDNKDFVCTLSGMFYIRLDKLYFTINMRSNDAILGTPTDVAFFCALQRHMLYHLKPIYPNLELGSYKHKVHSMHVYEKHFELIEKMLNEKTFKSISMPSINKALINFDGSPTEITKKLFNWASQDIREKVIYGQDPFINFIITNLINHEEN